MWQIFILIVCLVIIIAYIYYAGQAKFSIGNEPSELYHRYLYEGLNKNQWLPLEFMGYFYSGKEDNLRSFVKYESDSDCGRGKFTIPDGINYAQCRGHHKFAMTKYDNGDIRLVTFNELSVPETQLSERYDDTKKDKCFSVYPVGTSDPEKHYWAVYSIKKL